MKKFAVLVVFMLLLGVAFTSNASVVTINFDELQVKEVVTDQYASEGVVFSLIGTPAGYVEGPVTTSISQSTYPQASPGIALNPGDDGKDPFYDMELTFSTSIDYFSLDAFDSDEAVTVTGYFEDTEVSSVAYAAGSNLQHWQLELGDIGGGELFDRVVIDVVGGPGATGYAGGPEYFDNLVYNPVPEPATMFLLGGGLVGLAVIGRKKIKK